MAAGDVLLTATGAVILDEDGNVMLSDGAGDTCCCEEDGDCDVTDWDATYDAEFVGFTAGCFAIPVTLERPCTLCDDCQCWCSDPGDPATYLCGFEVFLCCGGGPGGDQWAVYWIGLFPCDDGEGSFFFGSWLGPPDSGSPVGTYTASDQTASCDGVPVTGAAFAEYQASTVVVS